MNRPNRARRRLLPAAALVAPVAVVMLMRLLGTGYPAHSVAAVPDPAPAAAPTEPTAPPAPLLASKAEVDRALAWLATHRLGIGGKKIARSPMDFEPAAPVAAPQAPAPVAPAPTAARATRPTGPVNLSSVMAIEGGALATINGRIVRVGDTLEPGWTVLEIDPRGLCVLIQGPDERRLALTRAGLREPK